MSKKLIYIYGAGGLGREILAMVKTLSEWTPAGFIDDSTPKDSLVKGVPVIGGREVLQVLKGEVNVVLAVGDPVAKCDIIKAISGSSIVFPILIHPLAVLEDLESITVGEGSIITAGCVLTTDINIGKHVLLNLNATVGHDAHIGNYSSVMPGVNIAGEVIIGDCVLIGSGTNVMNRMVISDRSRVGMGAVVTRSVAPGSTVVGVPARPLTR